MDIEKYFPTFQAGEERIIIAFERYLPKMGYEPIRGENYLYAKGTAPCLLVAHADTVHFHHKKGEMIPVFNDPKEGILWSPEGIGADDRAGIVAVFEILIRDLKPSILITLGEERGGIGAHEFTDEYAEELVDVESDIRFLLEVDRKGSEDAVYYGCDGKNKDWEAWTLSFGFKKAIGSYSDISSIMDGTGICGVNFSAGYYNAHQKTEYLNYHELEATIGKLAEIIRVSEGIPEFLFTPTVYNRANGAWNNWGYTGKGKKDTIELGHDPSYYTQGSRALLDGPLKDPPPVSLPQGEDIDEEEDIDEPCDSCGEHYKSEALHMIGLCDDCAYFYLEHGTTDRADLG